MKRTTVGVLALAALIVWQSNHAPAQGDKPNELREAMKKLNGGTSGVFGLLGRELKEETPDPNELRRLSKEVARLTAGLPKATPPKGDAASWKKLSQAYADGAAALDAAIARGDLTGARAAYQKLGDPTCMNCHKVHRKE
jgi:cytochrome c556